MRCAGIFQHPDNLAHKMLKILDMFQNAPAVNLID